MALVKFPEGQQRSGKQGGIVWSRNRFGAYARNRAVPVNPDSSRQRTVRNQFTQNAKAWASIPANSKLVWANMAANLPRKNRLGDTIFLTGAQQYQASNQALSSFGINIEVPASITPVPFPTDIFTGATDNLVLESIGDTTPNNYGYIIEATKGVSMGVTAGTVKSQYKQIGTIGDNTAIGATFDISETWEAIFGTPTIGSKVFIRVQWIHFETGQVSGWEVFESSIV